jgi:TRAP-type C4-dicarboxylate transport system substrate-binding protein
MMVRRWLVMIGAVGAMCGLADTAKADTTTLKIGTLAPAESPWGQVFKVWKTGVCQRSGGTVEGKTCSNGSLELQFFWNGQQGDETAMIGKIRTGQLDGAAVTAVGLGQIYKHVLVLQMPGLFREWSKLDAARAVLRPQFDTEFEKAGFRVLGWGDVGRAHLMSKGFMVNVPADLKHKNVSYLPGDPVAPMLYSLIGDITPKQISVTEVLPALTSGTLNVLNTPALAAEQLQWASRLDHINTMVSGIGIGALIFSSSKMKSLPPDAQAVLTETGKVAGEALSKRIRQEDDAAFERLKKRMTSYEPSAAQQAEWAKLFADTRNKLRGSTFNPQIFDEAVKAAQ